MAAPLELQQIHILKKFLDGHLEEVFLNELCKELMKDTVEHSRLKDLMRSAKGLGRSYEPVEGDTLLMLGAFWVLEGVTERIIDLKRKGVHLGVLIHDIIPITHPEFCEKALTDEFKSYFFSVISISDFVLTISDHSGQAVRKFIEQNNLPDTPVRTLRSAHKTWEAARNKRTGFGRGRAAGERRLRPLRIDNRDP